MDSGAEGGAGEANVAAQREEKHEPGCKTERGKGDEASRIKHEPA
jgi:hypothetical protein